eukprot:TRINITY_DN13071_c0_g1_i3.p1 TRINITY_DN13071_c0_g1~~TRINITY_DN13071_c0_g1_i3.p1  ORF type:complete len:110 (-),score=6.80 TRINITY_DN13071_c0_g1_i3:37-366(-)
MIQSNNMAVKRSAFSELCLYAKREERSLCCKLFDNSWMIRERAYHTLLQMQNEKSRLFQKVLLPSVKETIEDRRKNEKDAKLQDLLKESSQIIKVYFCLLYTSPSPRDS